MLSILDETTHPADRVSRREWLRIGGLSALGVSLADVLRGAAPSAARPGSRPKLAGDLGSTFGKAKNVIFLWLQGGPPQHETFDPKPDAPVDIRGPFKPIATNVPGIRFCELLPRTARHADRMAVIRSLSTRDDNHDVSGYWLLTGYPYGPGSARQIKPSDWPYFGSIVKMMKPSRKLPALSSVLLPDVMRLNDNVTPAGQTAGFLGKQWEPERFVGDPALPGYHVQGLALTGDLTRVPFLVAAAGLADPGNHVQRPVADPLVVRVGAGGGVCRGFVYGATDSQGTIPATDSWTPDDVSATLSHNLGLDSHRELQTPTGRPVQLFREGRVLPQVLSEMTVRDGATQARSASAGTSSSVPALALWACVPAADSRTVIYQRRVNSTPAASQERSRPASVLWLMDSAIPAHRLLSSRSA
jgi:hypothetical protein